jgi:hypothetical protein
MTDAVVSRQILYEQLTPFFLARFGFPFSRENTD